MIFGFFLIFIAAISIYIRGASIPYAIILLRFYCGIILVYGAFVCNKNLQITYAAFWIVTLFVLYEAISLSLGLTPFSYANFINAGIGHEIEGRMTLDANTRRVYGPAMNSSVSGSILAIIFFYILIGNNQFLLFKNNNMLLLAGLFIAFVLCGSGTAMLIFACLSLIYIINIRNKNYKKISFFHFPRFMTLSMVLTLILIFFGVFLTDFIMGVTNAKWNIDTYISGFNFKLFQISIFDSYKMILFGADLSGLSLESAGGDFVMLSFVYHFGLIYVLIFLAYLFYICRPENRIFLLLGIVSTFHYGTVFTLMGQVFFGALMAGSVLSKEFLQYRDNLSKSYTKQIEV